jgi:DNA-binding NarL/FixJ family response regulator
VTLERESEPFRVGRHEARVLVGIRDGVSNEAIADQLGLSKRELEGVMRSLAARLADFTAIAQSHSQSN